MSCLDNVFKVFEDLKISGVSRSSFWAREPIHKDGIDRKFRKPHFSGKLMNGVLFSWVESCILDFLNFQKVPSRQINVL